MSESAGRKKVGYICDPAKNTSCTKEGCMIFHFCRCTTHKEFAKTGENNKPIVAVRCDYDVDAQLFDEYVCGVTGLPCCGCSLFCQHRKGKTRKNCMGSNEKDGVYKPTGGNPDSVPALLARQ